MFPFLTMFSTAISLVSQIAVLCGNGLKRIFISKTFKLLPAHAFNLVMSKVLSSGNGFWPVFTERGSHSLHYTEEKHKRKSFTIFQDGEIQQKMKRCLFAKKVLPDTTLLAT